MKLVLFDAASGKTRPLVPADPRRVRLASAAIPPAASLAEARGRRLTALMESVLIGAGYGVDRQGSGADVFVGARAPSDGALWLAPGQGGETPLATVAARGFGEEDVRFWALRLPYRSAIAQDWPQALEAAREERRRLEAAARALAARPAGSAPNEAALAGYSRRVRAALARDLDVPDALQCLWDALRPGALSPATQLAAWRQARSWLGF